MAILKRSAKTREKRKPQVVTGDFELHYEEVISRNRYALVAVFAAGLVLIAAFVPGAVYQSVAENDRVSIEAERGKVVNPEFVEIVEGDVSASDNSYIEFKLKPTE